MSTCSALLRGTVLHVGHAMLMDALYEESRYGMQSAVFRRNYPTKPDIGFVVPEFEKHKDYQYFKALQNDAYYAPTCFFRDLHHRRFGTDMNPEREIRDVLRDHGAKASTHTFFCYGKVPGILAPALEKLKIACRVIPYVIDNEGEPLTSSKLLVKICNRDTDYLFRYGLPSTIKAAHDCMVSADRKDPLNDWY